MYSPAFLEIFVGFVVVAAWAWWLGRRSVPRVVVAALPWVAGTAVVLGQAAAFYAIALAMTGASDVPLVRYARWGSFTVVAGCLAVEAALTLWSLAQRTRNHHQARP